MTGLDMNPRSPRESSASAGFARARSEPERTGKNRSTGPRYTGVNTTHKTAFRLEAAEAAGSGFRFSRRGAEERVVSKRAADDGYLSGVHSFVEDR